MEKRLLIVYVCFCVILSCICLLPNKTPVFNVVALDSRNVGYVFHTSDVSSLYSSDGQKKYSDIEILKNGDNYIVKCQPFLASVIKKSLANLQGESIVFEGNRQDAFDYLSHYNTQIVLTENVDGIFILYAYVPNIYDSIYINSQKVNIELAVKNNVITIGCPIILGDY